MQNLYYQNAFFENPNMLNFQNSQNTQNTQNTLNTKNYQNIYYYDYINSNNPMNNNFDKKSMNINDNLRK